MLNILVIAMIIETVILLVSQIFNIERLSITMIVMLIFTFAVLVGHLTARSKQGI